MLRQEENKQRLAYISRQVRKTATKTGKTATDPRAQRALARAKAKAKAQVGEEKAAEPAPDAAPEPEPAEDAFVFDVANLGLGGDMPGRHLRSRAMREGDLGFRGGMHASFVQMGHAADDDHFMNDLLADANMGRKAVLSKRRGPFRNESGSSRIMSKSAHVEIRKRRMQLEITIRRHVTEHELDVLVAKLNMHMTSTSGTVVYLIHRGRRNLGTLDIIDLNKLRGHIKHLLQGSTVVGLLLVDHHVGGAMHTPGMHSARFARMFASRKTSFHV